MRKNILLALGIFTTIALSLSGLIIVPNWQFQGLKPIVKADGSQYPVPLTGDAAAGRKVYIDQGCIYCHTQQIRMKATAPTFGATGAPGEACRAITFTRSRINSERCAPVPIWRRLDRGNHRSTGKRCTSTTRKSLRQVP